MQKKKRSTELLIVAVFLTIITAIIMSGTFAKYTTTTSGTGIAQVAKWSIRFKDGEGNYFSGSEEFNLLDTTVTGNVLEGHIAPRNKWSI